MEICTICNMMSTDNQKFSCAKNYEHPFKAESNIPELLSAVEATDRSRKEIQKSIQSAIRELSVADDTSRTRYDFT